MRLTPPARTATLQRSRDIGRRMDEDEIDMRRHTAEGHPYRVFLGTEGEESSLRMHPDKTRQMSMRLDSARERNLARRIDHASRLEVGITDAD